MYKGLFIYFFFFSLFFFFLFFFFIFFFNLFIYLSIYRTITYTTCITSILLTYKHYLQYINYNVITLISLFTMQIYIIEKVHVCIQVTKLLQFF